MHYFAKTPVTGNKDYGHNITIESAFGNRTSNHTNTNMSQYPVMSLV